MLTSYSIPRRFLSHPHGILTPPARRRFLHITGCQPGSRRERGSVTLDPTISETMNSINLTNSRALDVHRWSDFPEADAFVDQVYALCQQGKKTQIERKHFKVLALDLYVAWLADPALKITVPMQPAAYKAKSRYNALRISRKPIDVVRQLEETGLIELKLGFHDRRKGGLGRVTRVWPTEALIALFRNGKLSESVVCRAEQEVIVLKDVKGKHLEYDDAPETRRMRQVIRDYNDLLSRQFIDIRRLNNPRIELSNGTGLMIGPSRQQVHRVFNRSSFDCGGRFYGAWWQQCPKEWRREIFINDVPTIEQDYSSLHIALLYARRGVNYYQTETEDAYQLATPPFLPSAEVTRRYAKRLLLTAINAKGIKPTFSAFRSDRRSSGDELGGTLSDKQLGLLLDGLRRRHPVIADDFGSDAAITLMRQDSVITEYVIKRFTQRGLAVLTVHDSYIVHFSYHDFLQEVLEEAFAAVTGMSGIRTERTGVAWCDDASWETQRLAQEAVTRSEGYVGRYLDWMLTSDGRDQAEKEEVHLVDG